ncbi:hypothetical protein KGR20_15765 [Cytobacillus oceanisediminis]|uniref:hypothetical protein n=1 Tax=Bacillaceae TaxID=186817 RepID=UPI001CCB5640|nr:hypothetical protein [Cytobacillus oceanisediminis]MBQ6447027.1 hypothetical protein [Bacillus sp. (in: firmicutes)]MBZ9535684.1 hypothetical protein [Cytobacillus oceanisediminis]
MNWQVSYMDNRKVRPVSFNLDDPFEFELNEYANKNGVFSKYIKRLIQRDKEKTFTNIIEVSNESSKKKGIAKSFI